MSASKTVTNIDNEYNICKSHGGGTNNRGLMQQHVISKLRRPELEDKFYKSCQHNIEFKKVINAQNIKIKHLTTKLLRLTNQYKKDEAGSSRYCYQGEAISDEQAMRIDELERDNQCLTDKLETQNLHLISIPHKHCTNIKTPRHFHKEILKSGNITHNDEVNKLVVDLNIAGKYESNNEHCLNKTLTNKETEEIYFKYEQHITKLEKDLEEQRNLASSLRLKYEDTKRSNHVKDKEVQADFEISKTCNLAIIDDLTKRLAEENILVVNLKNQLKTVKLAQKIFKEVEGRLMKLDNRIIKQCERNLSSKKDKPEKKETIIIDEKIVIVNELAAEKINAQVLNDLNNQLNSQLLDLQRDLDALRVEVASKNLRKTKSVEFIDKIVGTDEISKSSKIVSERKSIDTASDRDRMCDHSNSNSEDMEMNKGKDKLKISIFEKNSKLQPLLLDKEDCKKTEIHGNGVTANLEIGNNDVEVMSEKGLSFDDVTYDISNNVSPVSEISDSNHNEYLSDGEIPNVLGESKNMEPFDEEKIPKDPLKTENNVEVVLEILSNEMKQCRKLIDTTKIPCHSEKGKKPVPKKISPKIFSPKSPAECMGSTNRWNSQEIPKPSKGTFTLNIKSVKFTDRVMSYLDGLPFFLTWQFYDQLMTHTPIYTEQVTQFDFCSTYSVDLNRKLAAYFMERSVNIEIYKTIDKGSTMFASCGIDLKKMLSEANKLVSFDLVLESNTSTEKCGKLNCQCTFHFDSHFSDIIQGLLSDKNEPNDDLRNSFSSVNENVALPGSSKSVEQYKDFGTKKNEEEKNERRDRIEITEEPAQVITATITEQETVSGRIILTVLWLSFNDNSSVLIDENVTQIFVEYSFLGHCGQETESASVPKVLKSGEKMNINFRKLFKFERENNRQHYIELEKMLSRDSSVEEQTITFTVVSEPEEDPLGLNNCEDLGKAYFNILELLSQSENMTSCEVLQDVFLISNPLNVTGKLAVKIEGLDFMRMYQKEVM